MYKRLVFSLLVSVLGAAIVAAESAVPSPQALAGLDATQAIDLANAWGRAEQASVTSFVTTEAVTFEFADGTRTSVPLPEDQVMLAIAPFARHTHTCSVHYFSGCQGELTNLPVDVRAVSADGAVLFSGELTTLENGFLELWVPKNRQVQLTLSASGYQSRETVSTTSGAPTCITTMQLH